MRFSDNEQKVNLWRRLTNRNKFIPSRLLCTYRDTQLVNWVDRWILFRWRTPTWRLIESEPRHPCERVICVCTLTVWVEHQPWVDSQFSCKSTLKLKLKFLNFCSARTLYMNFLHFLCKIVEWLVEFRAPASVTICAESNETA